MKNEQTRREKGTIHRIVWYRARNEFSNKRATALCPAQHDNGNLSPSIIAPSLPISGAPISTAIGMLSIFSLPPAISSSNSRMNLLLISLLLGEPLSSRPRAIKPPRIILRKYFARHGVTSIYLVFLFPCLRLFSSKAMKWFCLCVFFSFFYIKSS